MARRRGSKKLLKRYRGTRLLHRRYRGMDLVYTHPDLPQITKFNILPAYLAASAGDNRAINFDIAVTGATRQELRDPFGNLIDTTQIPAYRTHDATSDVVFTLTAWNAADEKTVVHKTLRRTVPPSFTGGLTADRTYRQAPPLVYAIISLAWHVNAGHPDATLAWSGQPNGHHIDDPNRRTNAGGNGTATLTYVQTDTRIDYPLTLTATNPLTGETASIVAQVTVPPRGG